MATSAGKKDLVARFLTIFGDIKIFPGPLFFLYDPGSYLVKGEDMRQVMKIVQPKIAGRADGSRVAAEVKRQLG